MVGVIALGATLALGVTALLLVQAADSSQAQSGTMHNCPASGKWSIAVWEGESGTAASDALASCGTGKVDAAYSLDSPMGGWSRWFAGKPDVSNLAPLDEMQGVLALGSTAGPAATATPSPTLTPTAGTSTILGLPVVPGRTYVGQTSEGYPVAFWVSADGQQLEPYREGGEAVTLSFVIQVSGPEGCLSTGHLVAPESPWSQTLTHWLMYPPFRDQTGLYTWGTGEEIPISDEVFRKPSDDIVLSGSVQGGLASGQFDGSVEFMLNGARTCTFQPVTWTASLE